MALALNGHPLASNPAAEEMVVELECEVVEQLEEVVRRPAFLHAIEKATKRILRRGQSSKAQQSQEVPYHPLLQTEPDSEEAGALSAAHSASTPQAQPAEAGPSSAESPTAEFVVVDKHDAVEAMAFYIAQTLVQNPEAAAMSPKQLQQALSTALKSMKQSKFKRLCTWGRYAYRWTTMSYSAIQLWQNPWIVQAVLTALWTFSRIGMRAVLP